MRLVALVHADTTRTENFQRSGGRNRETAMGTVNPAGTFDHRCGEHARFAEQLERDAAADNVDDRVHRTDLVKVHLFRRHAVDLALGLSNTAEDGNRFFLHPIAQRTVSDQNLDIGKITFM